ncbi:MAG: hypothetical protein RMM29_00870 [Planctomycetota bacterium]|nr:hypothetical protein [Planctomycetota bacterium]MCX8040567.1 hypothetical protein [Planctomycetota bacterium]MDW8372187.1 hypothetical protein [Planctomycetota bacterium]
MHATTYDFDHQWFQLPPGFPLGDCHALVVDRRDHVFLLQQNGIAGSCAVLEFDREGRFVRGFGQPFTAGAHGMCLAEREGRETLWIVDYELPAIAEYTLSGEELRRLPLPRHPAYAGSTRFKPTDVAVAPDGSVYVADGYGASLIHRYDPQGRYVGAIGWPGDGPGQFSCPHGICIDARGGEPRLLVADRANVRVQVLTLDGEHVQTIIGRGLRYPCTLRVHGDLTLIPDLFGAVLIWDRDYRQLATLGAHPEMRPGEWPKHVAGYPNVPREDRLPGRFIAPHGIARDSRGWIFVGEWIRDGGRLTRLVPRA